MDILSQEEIEQLLSAKHRTRAHENVIKKAWDMRYIARTEFERGFIVCGKNMNEYFRESIKRAIYEITEEVNND